MSSTTYTHLRLGGWGREDVDFTPPEKMLQWLGGQLGVDLSDLSASGAGGQPPRLEASPYAQAAEAVSQAAAPKVVKLGSLAESALSVDPLDRLRHAVGQSLPDVLRHRFGRVDRLPDAVFRPQSVKDLELLFAQVRTHPMRLVPWGGGSSVTGGVNVPVAHEPVVTIDLEGLSGCSGFDQTSGLATFGAGTRGPQIEAFLNERGWTLGHFPQSWEHSTLGGWIVTHSSGQESLGYGSIESMVAGLEVAAPSGRVSIPALPASSAGPNLRQWMLGSEGRFGIVSSATMRVRRMAEDFRVEAGLLPDWESGAQVCRSLVQQAVPLTLMRLSDVPETEVAMTVGLGDGALARLLKASLRLKGIKGHGCLLLVGAKGHRVATDRAITQAKQIAKSAGAVWLGGSPGSKWKKDRFRHPYLRDALLDRGVATETLETAAPWSKLSELYQRVREALQQGAGPGERRLPVLCHLSHPYPDGASLYFTFFFRCPSTYEAAVARWAELKRRASSAIAEVGGAASHHHGVGRWHAPWLGAETSPLGGEMLRAVAQRMDPDGLMNPNVLLDPTDRLEE